MSVSMSGSGSAVRLSGLPKYLNNVQQVKYSILQHFLRESNGGGKIIRLDYPTDEEGTAILTFKEETAAKDVLRRNHKLDIRGSVFPVTVMPLSERGRGSAAAERREPGRSIFLPVKAFLALGPYDEGPLLELLAGYSLKVSGRTRSEVCVEGDFRELKRFRDDFYSKMHPEILSGGRPAHPTAQRDHRTAAGGPGGEERAGAKTRSGQNAASETGSRSPSNPRVEDPFRASGSHGGKEFGGLSGKRGAPSALRSPRGSFSKSGSPTGSSSTTLNSDPEPKPSAGSRLADEVSKLSVDSGFREVSRKTSGGFSEKVNYGSSQAAGIRGPPDPPASPPASSPAASPAPSLAPPVASPAPPASSPAPLASSPAPPVASPAPPAVLSRSFPVDADALRYADRFGERYADRCLRDHSVEVKAEEREDFCVVTLSVGDAGRAGDLEEAFRYSSLLFEKYHKDLRVEIIELSDFAPERRRGVAEDLLRYGKRYNVLVEGLEDRLRLVGPAADLISFMQVWKAKERARQTEMQGLKRDEGSGPVSPNYPHPPSTRRKDPEDYRQSPTATYRAGAPRHHAGDSQRPRGRPPSSRRPSGHPDPRREK